MRRSITFLCFLLCGLLLSPASHVARAQSGPPQVNEPSFTEAPGQESPEIKALIVAGTLRDKDGKPVKGALVYLYHTSAKGWYSDRAPHIRGMGGDEGHVRLFGYVTTGADGTFEVRTIRPAGYPKSDLPAHIHIEVQAPGASRPGLISEFRFDDDPRMTPRMRDMDPCRSHRCESATARSFRSARVAVRGPAVGEHGFQDLCLPMGQEQSFIGSITPPNDTAIVVAALGTSSSRRSASSRSFSHRSPSCFGNLSRLLLEGAIPPSIENSSSPSWASGAPPPRSPAAPPEASSALHDHRP